MEYPEERELQEATKAHDLHSMVVRSQSLLEKTLRVTIGEALVEPHALELDRASFPLKLDLSIALGVTPRELRPALLGLNKLRNQLAHDASASVDCQAATAIYQKLPDTLQENLRHWLDTAETPQQILRIVFGTGYCTLVDSIEGQRERKKRMEEWRREVDEFLEQSDNWKPVDTDGL